MESEYYPVAVVIAVIVVAVVYSIVWVIGDDPVRGNDVHT
jgi:hypothetical protein